MLMSNLLQCWSSNGLNNPVCEELARQLKVCTSENALGKGNKEQKSNINYHAARLYNKVNGHPHD